MPYIEENEPYSKKGNRAFLIVVAIGWLVGVSSVIALGLTNFALAVSIVVVFGSVFLGVFLESRIISREKYREAKLSQVFLKTPGRK